MYTDLGKRQDDEHVKDEQNNSTIAALAEDTSLSSKYNTENMTFKTVR
jgi:hypothetical protein